ncbi:MAG: alkaline phosphatase family protein [Bacteroidales bacterium]|nr:alkaline phosphatase family protein [Bacteroidales bacterium]
MKLRHILLAILLFFKLELLFSQTKNVVVVIIDGARYTETFGDPAHTYIPKMAALAEEGTIISEFYNDGITYTSRAVPALWCGLWTDVIGINYQGSNTQYTVDPSLFEYFRKQKNQPDTKCIYELKYVSSLWLQSFHNEYGSDYWPYTVSQNYSDEDVVIQAKADMATYQPQLLWVYLANVDSEGHSDVWENYTGAIKTADSLVFRLWDFIQNDPFYKDNTTLLVTNDHGRHTDDFSGHGCGCEGCKHIMFLAIGPDVKQNYISDTYRVLPDFAVTASLLLDVDMEYATGSVAQEIFLPGTDINSVNETEIRITDKFCSFKLTQEQFVSIKIYDVQGRTIKNIESQMFNSGYNEINYELNNLHGIFFIQLSGKTINHTQKVYLQ